MPKPTLTGYAQILEEKAQFPLKPALKWRQRENKRPATPYLVLPNYSGDNGTRPLDNMHDPENSLAVEILDAATGQPSAVPVLGQTYVVQCRVKNLGIGGCFAGIAEFYTATASAIIVLANGGARPQPLGYAGFMTRAGNETIAVCQRRWRFSEQTSSILVRAYDPIGDMIGASYRYAVDRHVARRDLLLLDQINDPEWKGAAVNIQAVNHVSQTFVPKLPLLSVIEIALCTGNPGRGGDTVTLMVLDQGQQIFSRSLHVSDGYEGYLHFDIMPSLPVAVGKSLTIKVHDTGKNVFHWKYSAGNTYRRGNAFFAGKPFDMNNFYFKTFGKI